jgi:hypothetical protein
MLVELQRSHGNALVARLLSDLKVGPGDPGRVESASRSVARQKEKARLASARGTIRAALAHKSPSLVKRIKDFTVASEAERLELIRIVLDQFWVGPSDEAALERIWKSFGARLLRIAKANKDLYEQCRDRGAELPPIAKLARLTLKKKKVSGKHSSMVGGVLAVGEHRYDLVLTPVALEVRVRIAFKKDSKDVKIPSAMWMGAIKATWNRFDAVKKDGSERFPIVMVPQAADSDAHVKVTVKKGDGRSSRTTWYEEDGPLTAAHEFGHMIGLPDEYQLTAGDYEAMVGSKPPTGATEETGKPKEIAKKLHDALYPASEDKKASEAKKKSARAAAALKVINEFNLRQGEFAQTVAGAYTKAYSVDLVKDIVVQRFDETEEYFLVDPFTFSTRTMMGQYDLATEAEQAHPVAPRHMAEFVAFVKEARGGDWEAKER